MVEVSVSFNKNTYKFNIMVLKCIFSSLIEKIGDDTSNAIEKSVLPSFSTFFYEGRIGVLFCYCFSPIPGLKRVHIFNWYMIN